MLNFLLTLIGLQEYCIKILWDDGGNELVRVKAWSSTGAIVKVSKTKDVVNKATMEIVEPKGKITEARHESQEPLGHARIDKGTDEN